VTGGPERFEQLLNPALGQNRANIQNYDQHDGGYVFIQGVAMASKGLTKFARTVLPNCIRNALAQILSRVIII
jgi:hypothetical protein